MGSFSIIQRFGHVTLSNSLPGGSSTSHTSIINPMIFTYLVVIQSKQRVERAEMKHPSSHSTRLVACVSIQIHAGTYKYICTFICTILLLCTDFDYSLQTHPDSRNAHSSCTPTHVYRTSMYCTYSHLCIVLYKLSKKARLTIRPASSAHM